MVRIGILDISGCSEAELSLVSRHLSKTLDIENKRNPKANAQSIFARLLLTEVYKRFLDSSLPEIIRNEKGKPRFSYGGGRVKSCSENNPDIRYEEKEIFFNITHDEGIIAVAVCDTSDVGIDVQSMRADMHSREKIEKRLLSLLDGVDLGGACELFDDTSLLFYSLDTVSCRLISEDEKGERVVRDLGGRLSIADADFLRAWTRLESLLKLSGGGFSDSSEVLKTALFSRSQGIFIKGKDGRIYSLTLSIYK